MRWILPFLVGAVAVSAAQQPSSVYKDKAFTEFFRRTNGIVACDGAFSVPLSDERALWLFGDSHVDCWHDGTVPCLFQVRNAAMVHDKADLQNVRALIGSGKGFRSLFKNSTNEDMWFWPVSGFQHLNVVYIYLSSLRKAGSGPFGFASTGQDFWGLMKFPELDIAGYQPLPDFHGIDFGAGFVDGPATNQLYAFGHKRRGIALDIYVARFGKATPATNWTFWDGQTWSAQPTNAAVIATQAATSATVCKIKDKFLLMTSEFSVACDQGKEIYVSMSDRATGTFSPRRKIFTIDDTVDGHYPFFYLPVAHPEFINTRGELLVTYCINGYDPCIRTCVNGRMNPDHYRPRAIRIPLEWILR
ncbi:MAG: hypothetical protein L0Y58_22685 [Verrucomicrobia subdivision 3 bacterium]|nr:hypothetical protein [Limisphaerales bacterium]